MPTRKRQRVNTTAQALVIAIRRQAFGFDGNDREKTAEEMLYLAIIERAVADMFNVASATNNFGITDGIRREAQEFLTTRRIEAFAVPIDLSPEYIRERVLEAWEHETKLRAIEDESWNAKAGLH